MSDIPAIFQGPLSAKTKKDLQDIADGLGLSPDGKREQILERVKTHISIHEDVLRDDPRFSGLIRRKPKKGSARSTPVEPDPELIAPVFKVPTLDPILESTPIFQRERDVRDVSFALKNIESPGSPDTKTPMSSSQSLRSSPSSLSGLPNTESVGPLANSDLISGISTHSLNRIQRNEAVEGESSPSTASAPDLIASSVTAPLVITATPPTPVIEDVRRFMSNSRNIWSLNSVCEILYVLTVIVPWQYFVLPNTTLAIPYPPLATVQSPYFWSTLFHWIVPTMIIPATFGNIITFFPNLKTSAAPFDPLSAAVIRLAVNMIYPHPSYRLSESVEVNTDVLGKEWRTVSAGVGVAFAFAEVARMMMQAITAS